jgi:hypothetical protein
MLAAIDFFEAKLLVKLNGGLLGCQELQYHFATSNWQAHVKPLAMYQISSTSDHTVPH